MCKNLRSLLQRSVIDSDDGEKPFSTKSGQVVSKFKNVNEILAKLKENIGQRFSVEKFNAWAHMINTGQHSSYDDPPDLPYFKEQSSIQKSSSLPSLDQQDCSDPGKCIHYRGECMDRLTKWHSLLEKGIINQDQYDEFQRTILNDIAKL